MEEDNQPIEQPEQIQAEEPVVDPPAQPSKNIATVDSLRKEMRDMKAKYEKQIAMLELQIGNYELEKEELIQEKEDAQNLYQGVLVVSPLSHNSIGFPNWL